MAGKPAIRVSGAKEFRDAMRHMGADLKDLSAVNKRAAEMVADAARPITPFLTGALRATVKARGTQTRGYVIAGGRGVPYAGVIHFGWPRHGITADPFLFDALEDTSSDVIAQYDQHIEALVEKVGRETPP